jgi:hypothetical protein
MWAVQQGHVEAMRVRSGRFGANTRYRFASRCFPSPSYKLPAHPFLAYTSALTHLLTFGSKETKPAPWVSRGKTGPSF